MASSPPDPGQTSARPSDASPRRARRRWIVALSLVLAPFVLIGGVLAALALMLGTESGSRRLIETLIARQNGAVAIEGLRGSIWEGIQVDRLLWSDERFNLDAQRVSLKVHWSSLLQARLVVPSFSVDTMKLRLPVSDKPWQMPQSLVLPLGWEVQSLKLRQLALQRGDEPALAMNLPVLSARYDKGRYSAQAGAFAHSGVHVSGLQLHIADSAPFALQLQGKGDFEPAQLEQIPPAIRAQLLPGRAETEFSLSGTASSIHAEVLLSLASMRARLKGEWAPFSDSSLRALEVQLDDIDPSRLMRAMPAARLKGRIDVDRSLRSMAFSLDNLDPGRLDGGRIPVGRASAKAYIEDQRIRLDDIDAALPGVARAQGSLAIDRTGKSRILGHEWPNLEGDLQLVQLDPQTLSAGWPAARIDGRINLRGDRLEVDLSRLLAQEDVALRGVLRLRGESIGFENLQARSALGTARIQSGWIRIDERRTFEASGGFEGIDPAQILSRFGLVPSPQMSAALRGTFSAHGNLGGASPSASGRVELREGQIAGQALGADASLSYVHGQEPRLSLDARIGWGRNRLRAQGALGRSDDVLQTSMALDSAAILDARLGGALALDAKLSGALLRPSLSVRLSSAQLVWDGRITADRLAVQSEIGDPRALAGIWRQGTFDPAAGVGGGDLGARLTVGELRVGPQTLQAIRIDASGSATGHRLSGAARWAGHGFQLGATGGFAAAQWQGVIDSLRADGIFTASLRQDARLVVERDSIRLSDLVLNTEGGALSVRNASWSPAAMNIQGDAKALSLKPLVEWLEREAGTAAGGAGQVSQRPLSSGEPDPRIEAADRLKRLQLDASWALSGPVWDRLDGNVSARLRPEVESGVAATDAILGDNKVDLNFRAGDIDGIAELSIPSLRFSRRYTAPDWTLDGALFFSGRVRGTVRAPELVGALRAEGLGLFNRSLGWRLRDGVIDARFDGKSLTINTLKFSSGDGAVTIAGALRLIEPDPGKRVSAKTDLPVEGRLALDARRLPIPLGPGQRLLLSGITELIASDGALAWRGRLRADEGLIELRSGGVPELPADVQIKGAPARSQGVAPGEKSPASVRDAGPAGWTPRVQTDLVIELGDSLQVRGGGVDARLAGELVLSGSLPGAPRVRGSVEVREGTFTTYGRKLAITRGLIRFAGELDNPVLDIVAMRRDQQVAAGVALTGSALAPRIRLVSEPDVPEAQKLSWLILGSALDDVTNAGQGRALGEAAFALLGRNDEGLIAGLTQRLGIDVVSVGASRAGARDELANARLAPPPATVGSTAGSSAAASAGLARQEVVTVSKRLSARLTLSYERGLSGLWNLVRLQYDISNRLSLRAQSGSENALDLLYFWWFD